MNNGLQNGRFKDTSLSVEERVQDLVSRLEIEEKILLLGETAPAIPAKDIPEYYHGNEALHGIVRPGKNTVFPQSIGLGATWNPDLIFDVATAISDEARAKHHHLGGKVDRVSGLLTFWSPVINMARDPRWGRTQETYGEDPYLTSRLGVSFVNGLQGNDPKYIKTIATPKHFAANNEEHNRFECQAEISERALREYYLPAFRDLVVKAKAQSIMGAYNAINGVPCCANKWLLTDLLREEWGFDGYVVTDCGAVSHLYDFHRYVNSLEEAAAAAINAGIDLECGSWCKFQDVFKHYMYDAIQQGLVTEDTLDKAVSRVLKARFRLGMFDPDESVPYARIPISVVGSKKHVQLALQSARESMVLLKNQKIKGSRLLPIDKRKIRSIAVVGPNADICQFGDYSGVPVHSPITPLQGILTTVGEDIDIRYVPWQEKIETGFHIVRKEHLKSETGDKEESGLKGAYYSNERFEGQPIKTRIDETIYFNWMNAAPEAHVSGQHFSVRWTGKVIAPTTGQYVLRLTVEGGLRLFLDGKLLMQHGESQPEASIEATIELSKDQNPEIVIEYFQTDGNSKIKMEWLTPVMPNEKNYSQELKAAAECDVVIAMLGLGTHIEIEGLDRENLELPEYQEQFIREIFGVNPNIVTVLINGSPLAINWIKENVPAILEAWYPGEQGGNAIAEVLFGKYNPGGKLPLTFYESTAQLPDFNDYEISNGRTYMYLKEEPLYCFGYGLSYTTFEYTDLKIASVEKSELGKAHIQFNLKNTGEWDGDEVVQVYLKYESSEIERPEKRLAAFKRIHLPAGDIQHVNLMINLEVLCYYDLKKKGFLMEPGVVKVMVGASSQDERLIGAVEIR